jgi:hypothetical protein
LNCGTCNHTCLSYQTCINGACSPADAGVGSPLYALQGLLTHDPTTNDLGYVAVEDLNGDGLPDIIAYDYNPGGKIFTFLNLGSGQYSSPISTPIPVPYIDSIVTGKFITGGHGDVIVSVSGTDAIWILPGDGSGGFGSAVKRTLKGSAGTMNLVAGDVTGDGILDLVVATNPANDFSDDSVAVLAGNGDGTFANPVFSTVGSIPGIDQPLFLADINGDHKLDLILGSDVALNQGGGTFGGGIAVGTGTIQGVGDLNEDGIPDLLMVAGDEPGAGCPLNPLTVLTGKGDGTFATGPTYELPTYPAGLVVGDVNGDGHQDVVALEEVYYATAGTAYFAVVYPGDGAGNLTPDPLEYPLNAGTDYPAAWGDLNGNGKTDVVLFDAPYNPDGGATVEQVELLIAQ